MSGQWRQNCFLRQWLHKFTAALAQARSEYEEIVLKFVKELDLGKGTDNVLVGFTRECGDVLAMASGDAWNISIDKAEMEAYDKNKMVPKGEGLMREELCAVGSRVCPGWVWPSRPEGS